MLQFLRPIFNVPIGAIIKISTQAIELGGLLAAFGAEELTGKMKGPAALGKATIGLIKNIQPMIALCV